jgi:transposase
MTTTDRNKDYHASKRLYLALELSSKSWKLAFTVGLGQAPRLRTIEAGSTEQFERELKLARKRFGLSADTPVVSCYEAGRDAFWVHRWLEELGVRNQVVDSSSIQVDRRARRAKSDGLDARSLVTMLVRYYQGEHKVWGVVRVPSRQAEDARHVHRQLRSLKSSRTQLINRIRGLLATQGVSVPKVTPALIKQLARLRQWDGSRLGTGLRARLAQETQHLGWVCRSIKLLEKQRSRQLKEASSESMMRVAQLMKLKGIGINSAWILEQELFCWRQIRNGRQLGALAGLTPTPYQTGNSHREQGISKAGIRFVRGVSVEMGWMWVRYQPKSHLTKWYQRRFAQGGKRARKVGIVALTRRLLIELWRYRQSGVLPQGAVLKSEFC